MAHPRKEIGPLRSALARRETKLEIVRFRILTAAYRDSRVNNFGILREFVLETRDKRYVGADRQTVKGDNKRGKRMGALATLASLRRAGRGEEFLIKSEKKVRGRDRDDPT